MRRSKIIIIAILLIVMSGCSVSNNKGIIKYNSDTTTLDEYIEKSDNIGAVFPNMHCVGNKYIVLASYFGMYLIDIEKAQVVNYINLEKYGCNYFQGDIITEVVIDANENNIYFYNSENGDFAGNIYDFNIKNQTVEEIPADEFADVQLQATNCELTDLDKLINDVGEGVKEKLETYNSIEKSDIYRVGDVTFFLTAEEWKLSNLKLILISSDTDELNEVCIN